MNSEHIKHFFTTTTARLTVSYLGIIMIMSIGFSIVFYNTSLHELNRQLPPQSVFQTPNGPNFLDRRVVINGFIQDRIEEGRRHLLFRLILINTLVLISGAGFGYWLARRTLEPIEANMEAQNQFVSDASHELRTPLTALQTTNEVALRKKKLTSAEAKEILQSNIDEVLKLKILTDNLLRLAKQDTTTLNLQSVMLPDIVTDATNQVMQSAIAKNISIADSVKNVMVQADKPGLTQAVVVLLDNAVKYSPSGGKIEIDAYSRGKQAYIKVRDHGGGITKKDLPHIFDRFYRADQARNKEQADGYGIGLALAQKIIASHDGEITVASTPGKGATFTISLPLS
jgi:two-component system, OmpR family, sensor histidine kinase CiaH